MDRNEAWEKVKGQVSDVNLRKHMLAAEAVMRELAAHFGEDQDRWGLAGLVHDIDYEKTYDDPEKHSLVGADMLTEMGFGEDVVDAVRAHNDRHGLGHSTRMSQALYSSDPLTGFIVAAALVHPDKKLASIDVPFLMKRFKKKDFARGANREVMKSCSELGLSLEEFMEIGLRAMQGVSGELGL